MSSTLSRIHLFGLNAGNLYVLQIKHLKSVIISREVKSIELAQGIGDNGTKLELQQAP
ncbi:hypothetical protein ACYUJ6_05600 [Clostridium sp. JNZ X4-2]